MKSKTSEISLVILAAGTLTAGLVFMKSILVPFVFSLFFFSITRPLIDWIQKKLKAPHIVAIGMTFILTVVMVSGFVLLIASSLEEFLSGAHLYRNKFLIFLNQTQELATRYGIEINDVEIRKALAQLPIASIARDLTGDIAGFLGNTVLVLVFLLFLLSTPSPHSPQSRKGKASQLVQSKISRYAATKAFTSLLTGVAVWILLAVFGVELAFMFAALTFLFNFIPNIGSLIATLLPLPILLLQFGLGWQLPVVLGISVLIQFTVGNILETQLMGESLDLHPVTILIFLMFWGMVWGLPGMFLAVPITAVLKIVLERIEATQEFAQLLAGR